MLPPNPSKEIYFADIRQPGPRKTKKDMKTDRITGRCYCRSIRYSADAHTFFRVNCHCENCRRAIGAQSVAFISVAINSFSWDKGKPVRYRTDTGAWRTFCPDCGTSLTYESGKRTDQVDIITATLDYPEAYAPEEDAWEEEKLPWVPLVENE